VAVTGFRGFREFHFLGRPLTLFKYWPDWSQKKILLKDDGPNDGSLQSTSQLACWPGYG